MITTGGRTDIIAQQFLDEYIRDHGKLFEKINVGQNEAMIKITDGMIGPDIITNSNTTILPGFLESIKEKILPNHKKHIELLIVDTTPRSISIPYRCKTRDGSDVTGVLTFSIRISTNDLINIKEMMIENLVSDDRYSEKDIGKLKELSIEDITNSFRKTYQFQIQSITSKHTPMYIGENEKQLVEEISENIRSSTDNWLAYGLDVGLISASISAEDYEYIFNRQSELEKKQKINDLEYQISVNDIEAYEKLKIALMKSDNRVDLEKIQCDFSVKSLESNKELELRLSKLNGEIEAQRLEIVKKIENAKSQAEIDEIQGNSKVNIEKSMIELEDYRKKKELEFMRGEAEVDVYRTEHRMKSVVEMQNAKDMGEVSKINAKGEIDKRKAYNEGFEDGLKQGRGEASEVAHIKAYDEGYKKGIEEGKANTNMAEYQRGYNDGMIFGNKTALEQFRTIQGDRVDLYAPVREDTRPHRAEYIKCRSCGELNSTSSAFCNKCGERL